jgi:phosphopantothenoylcysteine decarboxylase/phosphopantothenate--cysteine ligase
MNFDQYEKKKVVLGVAGSIAAYKAVELARLLITRGCEVRVILTQSASEFVGALTFEAITHNKVCTDFWESPTSNSIEHIELADWADVIVVAPATADVIAKMVSGNADTPLTATILASKSPVLLAPAMNVNMWENIATQTNVETLKSRGVRFVAPEDGELACGWYGSGRLADLKEIFYETRRCLSPQDFAGRRVVISAGPTREAIDPVRFLSNRSSGKMGLALATEAYRRGADVVLVHGPIEVELPAAIKCVQVVSASEMYAAVLEHSFETETAADIVVMSAAVADYRPKKVSETKIKKRQGISSIELEQNVDILAALGAKKAKLAKPFLVGFAVETGEIEHLIEQVQLKLEEKNADLIIGNFAEEAFELDTNRVWLLDRFGRQDQISTNFKSRIADRILDEIHKRL